MELLREWITGITAASIIVAAASILAPKNTMGRIVRLAGAALLIAAILAPVRKFDVSMLSPYTVRYNADYEKAARDLEAENQRIQAFIIQEKMSTYILQRAEQIGVHCRAAVDLGKSEENSLYPAAAEIHIPAGTSEAKRLMLAEIIEKELAIPEDKQVYIKE